jgi:predicted dehydrogenase
MIRIGVIGVGWWANAVHVRGILSHPGAELAALCCRSEEKLHAAGREFGVDALFTNYEDLLALDDLDAVTISTTHNAHYPAALAALQRGLHVFCEKPLGLNSQETEHLVQAARDAGVKTMVAFTNRWVPEARVAKRTVEEGAIGDILHYTVTKFASYGGPKSRWIWRTDPALAGGGVLFDLGCHVIDLAQWVIAPIRSVSASQKTITPERPRGHEMLPTPVDDVTAFLAEFAGGLQGVFHISWTAIGSRMERHEICGSEGTLTLDLDHDDWINALHISRPRDATPEPVPIPDWAQGRIPREASTPEQRQIAHQAFIEDHPSLVRAFIDAIVTDGDSAPTFEDGHATQCVMGAIIDSNREKRWAEVCGERLGLGS